MNLDERLYQEPLSLKIKPGDVPFELIGRENHLGPEDWAWQFLRLNDDYQTAYRRAREKQQHAGEGETRQSQRIVLRSPHRHILADEDDCRRRFGLSAWLDPKQSRLPELDRGESWFSPLSPIGIASAYLRPLAREVADLRALAPEPAAQRADAWHSEIEFYVVTNGVFGRPEEHNIENVFNDGKRLRYRYPYLFFLVDSSIPPAGQLLEIENFVGYIRKRLVNAVCTLPPPFRQRRTKAVVEVLNEKLASCIDFPLLPPVARPLAPGEKTCDPSSLWSVAKLDFRVPLKENIDFIRGHLIARHKELVAAHVAAPPPWERFRHELSAPRQTDGAVLTDGYSLKAYAVIAELRQIAGRDLTPAEIEHVIKERSCPVDSEQAVKLPESLDGWLANRVNRIAGYIEHAQRFVAGNYRWLIYGQKPDAS